MQMIGLIAPLIGSLFTNTETADKHKTAFIPHMPQTQDIHHSPASQLMGYPLNQQVHRCECCSVNSGGGSTQIQGYYR